MLPKGSSSSTRSLWKLAVNDFNGKMKKLLVLLCHNTKLFIHMISEFMESGMKMLASK